MPRTMIFPSKALALTIGVAAAAVPAAAVAQNPAVATPAPAAAPAQVPATHTVEKGNTLWGLAQQYFGDALLWPQIYRLNTDVVEDPHWIYPGEVLRLHAEGPVVSVPAETTKVAVTPPPAAPAETVAVAAPADTAHVAADTAKPAAEAAAAAPAETTAVAEAPEPEDTTPLFPPSSGLKQPDVMQTTFEDNYRPLRRSDFYTSGFLSEGQVLPWGQVVGTVTPLQIHSSGYADAAMIYGRIALTPPKGGSYQVGDTLLLARIERTEKGWGDVVVPVGLAKVVDVTRAQNQAVVIAQYGPIHNGTLTLMAEKFVDPGNVHPEAVANGLKGHVLFARDREDLKGAQAVVFIDRGKADGVKQGDQFEVRRLLPARSESAVAPVPEVVAVLKIVHVRDHSATGRVIKVYSPAFGAGSPVQLIARLPG